MSVMLRSEGLVVDPIFGCVPIMVIIGLCALFTTDNNIRKRTIHVTARTDLYKARITLSCMINVVGGNFTS